MKIDTIKQNYKDEWVLVSVTKEDQLNRPEEGTVLAHSRDRDEIYRRLKKLPKGFRVATMYTGQVPSKDMVFAFHDKVIV